MDPEFITLQVRIKPGADRALARIFCGYCPNETPAVTVPYLKLVEGKDEP